MQSGGLGYTSPKAVPAVRKVTAAETQSHSIAGAKSVTRLA
jgi:hypothetical protein